MMDKKTVINIQHKIIDYKRFGFILFSLSAFLYLGSIIPFEGKNSLDTLLLSSASLTAIIIAIVFHVKTNKLKRQLAEEDHHDAA